MTEVNFAARLEPFLLMGKSAKGAAAAKLVQDVTAAPGVFVFAELLELPSIQDLAGNPQHAPFLGLLKLFSYQTYQDYVANRTSYPSLNPAQLTKLKHLSLVSLAARSRILPYTTLQAALDVSTIRELEDLIIDALHQDLIRGKLDQQAQHFEVEAITGRDLPPGELPTLLAALREWSERTAGVLTALDSKIAEVAAEEAAAKAHIEEHEKRRDALLGELATAKAKGKNGPLISNNHDLMDLDENAPEKSGGGGFFGMEWGGRKKNARGNQNIPDKQARKRNRF